jgi:hypothetical protein
MTSWTLGLNTESRRIQAVTRQLWGARGWWWGEECRWSLSAALLTSYHENVASAGAAYGFGYFCPSDPNEQISLWPQDVDPVP